MLLVVPCSLLTVRAVSVQVAACSFFPPYGTGCVSTCCWLFLVPSLRYGLCQYKLLVVSCSLLTIRAVSVHVAACSLFPPYGTGCVSTSCWLLLVPSLRYGLCQYMLLVVPCSLLTIRAVSLHVVGCFLFPPYGTGCVSTSCWLFLVPSLRYGLCQYKLLVVSCSLLTIRAVSVQVVGCFLFPPYDTGCVSTSCWLFLVPSLRYGLSVHVVGCFLFPPYGTGCVSGCCWLLAKRPSNMPVVLRGPIKCRYKVVHRSCRSSILTPGRPVPTLMP